MDFVNAVFLVPHFCICHAAHNLLGTISKPYNPGLRCVLAGGGLLQGVKIGRGMDLEGELLKCDSMSRVQTSSAGEQRARVRRTGMGSLC